MGRLIHVILPTTASSLCLSDKQEHFPASNLEAVYIRTSVLFLLEDGKTIIVNMYW